ncbi:hypothetical protein BH09ACT6_BH09ACT6_23830 [soil metagenome]
MAEIPGPLAGLEYPGTFGEFQEWFGAERGCFDFLASLRWPTGFVCPKCTASEFCRTGDGLWMCRACQRRTGARELRHLSGLGDRHDHYDQLGGTKPARVDPPGVHMVASLREAVAARNPATRRLERAPRALPRRVHVPVQPALRQELRPAVQSAEEPSRNTEPHPTAQPRQRPTTLGMTRSGRAGSADQPTHHSQGRPLEQPYMQSRAALNATNAATAVRNMPATVAPQNTAIATVTLCAEGPVRSHTRLMTSPDAGTATVSIATNPMRRTKITVHLVGRLVVRALPPSGKPTIHEQ